MGEAAPARAGEDIVYWHWQLVVVTVKRERVEQTRLMAHFVTWSCHDRIQRLSALLPCPQLTTMEALFFNVCRLSYTKTYKLTATGLWRLP